MKRVIAAAVLSIGLAASGSSPGAADPQGVCAACVRATLERLAGDQLNGRKCGSGDEHAAAQLIIAQLRQYGVRGAFHHGGYLQPVRLLTPTFATPPVLEVSGAGGTLRLEEGKDMVAFGLPASLDAPVLNLGPDTPADALAGKLVVVSRPAPQVIDPLKAGAAAVARPAEAASLARWNDLAARAAGHTDVIGGYPHEAPTGGATLLVRPERFAELSAFTGGVARMAAPRGPPLDRTTYNVVAVIHGRDKDADRRAVLLSAHYDHLGVRNGVIFHGADDDASGTAAVLEFARILGSGPPPRRTVYFALFGCEEEGGLGAQYFQAHPPEPLVDLAANIEFEMIGVDDPGRPGVLMLTGWERSNLGPTLREHGASIGPDPHPEQRFFQRSDNYQLALRGVVAQTVSAWALTPTYHSPSDDLAHVDVGFMSRAIGSLVGPVKWLLNSEFQPAWNPGGQP